MCLERAVVLCSLEHLDEMLVSKKPSQTPFLCSHVGHSVIIGGGVRVCDGTRTQ